MLVKSDGGSFILSTFDEYPRRSNNMIYASTQRMYLEVRAGKFLGFYLMKQGIKANPDKCDPVIQMSSLTMKREVKIFNGMLIALN